jgi:hypothetical protein
MIGQSVLFLGRKNHKAVLDVFGYGGNALYAPGKSDAETKAIEDVLRSFGIWPVVLRVHDPHLICVHLRESAARFRRLRPRLCAQLPTEALDDSAALLRHVGIGQRACVGLVSDREGQRLPPGWDRVAGVDVEYARR